MDKIKQKSFVNVWRPPKMFQKLKKCVNCISRCAANQKHFFAWRQSLKSAKTVTAQKLPKAASLLMVGGAKGTFSHGRLAGMGAGGPGLMASLGALGRRHMVFSTPQRLSHPSVYHSPMFITPQCLAHPSVLHNVGFITPGCFYHHPMLTTPQCLSHPSVYYNVYDHSVFIAPQRLPPCLSPLKCLSPPNVYHIPVFSTPALD